MEIVGHISDEMLEQYAMERILDPESEALEEHLLICPECRDRLQTMEEYVAAMKSAAGKTRESERDE